MDSLEAFCAVMASLVHTRHVFGILIHKTQSLLAREWSVTFSHVLRSGNSCNDFLAHQGAVFNSDFVVWETPFLELALPLCGDTP